MAIAFDNASGVNITNPGTSQTTGFTTSGSDRLLIVAVLGDNAASSGISGITYAGVAMTKLDTNRSGDLAERAYDLYYLKNPASGSNNVVISRGVSGLILSVFTSYTGVDQTTGVTTSTKTNDATADTTLDTSITTTVNNSWGGIIARDNGTSLTAGSGLVVRADNASNGFHLGDSGAAIATAGNHTFNGTWGVATIDSTIMFEILAVASASGPANLKSYNTNLKANIKSINTNLIANVKSLNTNT